MSVGRISMLSTASARIAAAVVLAGFLPGVKADCWVNSDNVEYCDGLSALARAMIGLALFLVLLAVIFTMYAYRRRRVRQSHLAYVQQAQQGSGSAYGPYGSPGGPPPFSPQYPPPTHNGLNSPYFYDPTTGFAPPAMAPPQYYPPPPGAPPIRSQK